MYKWKVAGYGIIQERPWRSLTGIPKNQIMDVETNTVCGSTGILTGNGTTPRVITRRRATCVSCSSELRHLYCEDDRWDKQLTSCWGLLRCIIILFPIKIYSGRIRILFLIKIFSGWIRMVFLIKIFSGRIRMVFLIKIFSGWIRMVFLIKIYSGWLTEIFVNLGRHKARKTFPTGK